MPIDAQGVRADVIIYGGSTVKRMNMGRMYEHMVNAAARDLVFRLKESAGFDRHLKFTEHQLEQIVADEETVLGMWNQLLGFYKIVAPIQHEILKDDPNPARHVRAVLKDGHLLYVPPDNPVDNLDMAREVLNGPYRPHYGPVTYTDSAGNVVTTHKPVLIGGMHMMLLEKLGEDWSAVASAKVNHFGVPAKLSNHDKNTTPGRQAPIRGLGESETRSTVCTIGPEATMELIDRSNNLEAHQVMIESILRADKPTAIKNAVPRDKVPFGNSRPVQIIKHVLECRGMVFKYKGESDA